MIVRAFLRGHTTSTMECIEALLHSGGTEHREREREREGFHMVVDAGKRLPIHSAQIMYNSVCTVYAHTPYIGVLFYWVFGPSLLWRLDTYSRRRSSMRTGCDGAH